MYFIEVNGTDITDVFSDENGNVPVGATQISDNDFQTMYSNPNHFTVFKYEDGAVSLDGAKVFTAYVATKQRDVLNVVQELLDNTAKSKGYDSIFTAVTYADEASNTTFQAEGQALRAWRSEVWTSLYAILADWEGGVITEPTVDEIVAQLPTITW